MPVRITCPACKSSYPIDDSLRGKRINCRDCGKQMQIPGPPAVKPQQPANKAGPQKAAVSPSKKQPAPSRSDAVVAKRTAPTSERPAPKQLASERGAKRLVKRRSVKSRGVSQVVLFVGGGLMLLFVLLVGVIGVIVVLNWKPASQPIAATQVAKGPEIKPVAEVKEIERKPIVQAPVKQQPEVKVNPAPTPQPPQFQAKLAPKREVEDKPFSPPPGGDGVVNPQVMAMVKQATVLVRVPAGNIMYLGSGFFGIEPGVVLTNTHVLGMLNDDSPPPKIVEIIYKSGEKGSRNAKARVLGVDSVSHLAVLRVEADGLPQPLAVNTANDLIETQRLYVVGFAVGDQLAKSMIVSPSSVASLRKLPTGEMHQVQVSGGVNPGNSGGPVVNASGELVGVAVAALVKNEANYALPCGYVHNILNGRVNSVPTCQTARDGSQIKMKVEMDILDPLGRVQKVDCEWWMGAATKPRPASDTPPISEPGDSPHQKIAMDYQGGKAKAELVLPGALPSGQVIWIQAMIVNGAGKSKWSEPISINPTGPVDKQPAMLALKHYWGARPVTLKTTSKIKIATPETPDIDLIKGVTATMTETMVAQRQGLVELRMRYRKYAPTLPPELKSPKTDAAFKKMEDVVKFVHADLMIDDKNNLKKNTVDLSTLTSAPADVQNKLVQLHSDIQESLGSLAVPLPGRKMQAGDTWKAKRPLPIPFGDKASVVIDVVYTFQGVRQREGRLEGLIGIAGKAKDKFEGGSIFGSINGSANFDLTAFQFSAVNVKGDVVISDGQGKKITISMDNKMERLLGKELLNVRGQLMKDDPTKDEKNRSFKIHNVELQGGKPAAISLESPKGPGWFDTYVRILDANGKTLADDDDGGVDQNSLAIFTPPQTGTYQIKVSSFSHEQMDPAVGDYLLVVRQ